MKLDVEKPVAEFNLIYRYEVMRSGSNMMSGKRRDWDKKRL